MKKMKPFIGYIPAAIVIIPFTVVLTWQSLFYKGCMHGFQYFLAVMMTFFIGGVLNFSFLLYVLMKKGECFLFPETWKSRLAKGGSVTAVATLIFQLYVLIWVIHDML